MNTVSTLSGNYMAWVVMCCVLWRGWTGRDIVLRPERRVAGLIVTAVARLTQQNGVISHRRARVRPSSIPIGAGRFIQKTHSAAVVRSGW